MKRILNGLLAFVVGLYLLSLIVVTPYSNWRYAKQHGFIKWLFLGEIVATAKSVVWPYFIFVADDASSVPPAQAGKIAEYTDNEYGYAFQLPADWKMMPTPPRGEAGEVRVVMKSPKSTMLMVSVGDLERPISKQSLKENPKGNDIIDAIIDCTVESVYKKTSRDIGATRMVVGEKTQMPSEVAVKFAISTMHFVKAEKGELPMMVAGLHYIPFGKNRLITFLMTSPLNPKATEENTKFKNIFNSFHLLDEKPQ